MQSFTRHGVLFHFIPRDILLIKTAGDGYDKNVTAAGPCLNNVSSEPRKISLKSHLKPRVRLTVRLSVFVFSEDLI